MIALWPLSCCAYSMFDSLFGAKYGSKTSNWTRRKRSNLCFSKSLQRYVYQRIQTEFQQFELLNVIKPIEMPNIYEPKNRWNKFCSLPHARFHPGFSSLGFASLDALLYKFPRHTVNNQTNHRKHRMRNVSKTGRHWPQHPHTHTLRARPTAARIVSTSNWFLKPIFRHSRGAGVIGMSFFFNIVFGSSESTDLICCSSFLYCLSAVRFEHSIHA